MDVEINKTMVNETPLMSMESPTKRPRSGVKHRPPSSSSSMAAASPTSLLSSCGPAGPGVTSSLDNDVVWKTIMLERQQTMRSSASPIGSASFGERVSLPSVGTSNNIAKVGGGSSSSISPATSATTQPVSPAQHNQQQHPASKALFPELSVNVRFGSSATSPPPSPLPALRESISMLPSATFPSTMLTSVDVDGFPGGSGVQQQRSSAAFAVGGGETTCTSLRALADCYRDEVRIKTDKTKSIGVVIQASYAMIPNKPSIGAGDENARGRMSAMAGSSSPTSLETPKGATAASIRGRSNSKLLTPSGGRRPPQDATVVFEVQVNPSLVIPKTVFHHLVPYEKQGNKEFYTVENIRKRNAMKQHFIVMGALDQLWNDLPKTLPSRKYINNEIFQWMHQKFYFNFAAEPSEVVWKQIVSEDWRVVCKDRLIMTEEELKTSMFHMTDVWCQTLDVEEYRQFIDACVAIVNAPPAYEGTFSETGGKPTRPTPPRQSTAGRGRPPSGMPVSSRLTSASTARSAVTSPPEDRRSPLQASVSDHQQQQPSNEEATDNTHSIDGSKKKNNNNAEEDDEQQQQHVVWSKEDITAASDLLTLKVMAEAHQSAKLVDAYVSSGIAQMETTEVRQLQGLFRLISEIEDQEEDELLRIIGWAKMFIHDFIRPKKSQCQEFIDHHHQSSDSSSSSSSNSNEDLTVALRAIEQIEHLVSFWDSIETDVQEFIDSESSDRGNIVAAFTKVFDSLNEGKRDDAAGKLTDLRGRISGHWRGGRLEKQKTRSQISRSLADLTVAFQDIYQQLTDLIHNDPSLQQQANEAARGCDLDCSAVLQREVLEMQRQVAVESSRSSESEALVAFISKELAAQKPIVTLLEAALAQAQQADVDMKEVEVGTAEWRVHLASLGKIEIGLYNVIDALHQEMQKGLSTILDSCELSIAAIYDTTTTSASQKTKRASLGRFDRVPQHILEVIERDHIKAAKHSAMLRDAMSKRVSDLRLQLNEYFTKMCSEEKKLLSAATAELGVVDALKLREPYLQQLQKRNSDNLLNSPSTTNAEGSADESQNFVSRSWFTVITESRPSSPRSMSINDRTFCSVQFFSFLQQSDVDYTCRLLSDLTDTVSSSMLQLHQHRQQCEAALSATLAEVDQRAREQQEAAAWSLYPTVERSREDRQSINLTLGTAAAQLVCDTVHTLIAMPQEVVASKGQLFYEKALEWKRRKSMCDLKAKALKQRPLRNAKDIAQESSSKQLDQANEEVDRYHRIQDQNKAVLDALRKEETENLVWIKSRKQQRGDRSTQALQILLASEQQQQQDESVDNSLLPSPKAVSPSSGQRLVISSHRIGQEFSPTAIKTSTTLNPSVAAKLQRIVRCTVAMRTNNIMMDQAGGLSRTATTTDDDTKADQGSVNKNRHPRPFSPRNDVSHLRRPFQKSVGYANSTIQSSQLSPTIAGDVMVFLPGGGAVCNVRGDVKFEKRKQAYLRNKCSNADIFVGECIKAGCAILDAARVQLSCSAKTYDAMVIPFSGVSFHGAPIADLISDILWLNPTQQLCLSQSGLSDESLDKLCKMLTGHRHLMFLDVRMNPNITDATPLLKLFDSNSTLMFVATHGTGISDKAAQELHRTSLEHRSEKETLTPVEADLFSKHFACLEDHHTGYITMDSLDTCRSEASRQKASNGNAYSAVTASQSLIAVFLQQTMKASDRWTPSEVLRKMFPAWSKTVVTTLVEQFERFS